MGAPTYANMEDHTETVQVDYDPQRITYAQLLDIFWKGHEPTNQSWSRQYMHAIFYHNEEQQRQALASRAAVEQKIGHAVKTEVLPVRSFTMAEDYHQKYILKRHQVLRNEMTRIYPTPQDFVDSTAVTRLNGYAGGNGNRNQLSREIDILGLSASGKKRLADLVRR
jgi:peptide methionine sulfoxide reductase MsrA